MPNRLAGACPIGHPRLTLHHRNALTRSQLPRNANTNHGRLWHVGNGHAMAMAVLKFGGARGQVERASVRRDGRRFAIAHQ